MWKNLSQNKAIAIISVIWIVGGLFYSYFGLIDMVSFADGIINFGYGYQNYYIIHLLLAVCVTVFSLVWLVASNSLRSGQSWAIKWGVYSPGIVSILYIIKFIYSFSYFGGFFTEIMEADFLFFIWEYGVVQLIIAMVYALIGIRILKKIKNEKQIYETPITYSKENNRIKETNKRFCSNCGKKVGANEKFCEDCGSQIK